ncbi:hypothetical protein QSX71_004580 [Vibrio vulnificus]|nr:hypothetical protein [Vibrio vulnificus]EGR7987560.1 hypothetical protein [Vibrio vulnificus]ELC9583348.1 hypothetical protein [Vibrio vulnificus]ELQ3743169.1 hypothetical protein [Vibrio vulnificus]ELS5841783.1 hypothetical protein [Vibrio vulnificus]
MPNLLINKEYIMKKMALSLIALMGLAGCTSTMKEPPLTLIEVGSKANAQAAIEFDYNNQMADFEYQRQKLVVYINALPEQREFQLCDPSLEDTGCKSAISAWQNALKPDSTRVWVRYDLNFMMQMAKESGVRLPKMNGLQSQVAVDWGVPEQVSGQTRYDETGEMVQQTLTLRAYKL